ncbi:hypothetical protein [Pseudomonas aeruginosa]|uniref:hypothetical protein n=1 Tax=Pseudomonas aeruginosa TaxID=287 RepID=UPI003CC6BE31
MGLFNAHAVAQQRADRIATLLQSWGARPRGTPRGAAPAGVLRRDWSLAWRGW